MDKYGRLLPAPDRFPSAAEGRGFKPLADYVHGKGLKFGIHVMRGIPRQAVARNTSVFGSDKKARDVADTASVCVWLNSMFGVDMDRTGAQEYYNSLINLYAGWGVDYVKVDDLLYVVAGEEGIYQGVYHHKEIEAVRKAIDACGRPIVFSISPGDHAPVDEAPFLAPHADLWRVSQDFGDDWDALKRQFSLCEKWAPFAGPGHWPDADMLQLGRLSRRGPAGPERESKFSFPEQMTHLTLWAIARSPLMYGGDLTCITPPTYGLITNREVVGVNQNSGNNRQLFRRGNHVAWTASVPGSNGLYLAVFNLGEDGETPVYVPLGELKVVGACKIRNLWERKEIGSFENVFLPVIPAHGAGLYRINP